MKTYLKYQPPGVQFMAFLGLAGGFIIVNTVFSSFFFKDIGLILLDKNAAISPYVVDRFKWAQFASSVISFILPSLLFGYYSSPKSLPYIGLQKQASATLLLGSVVLLVTIQPLIGWIDEVNAKVKFGSMQQALLEMEANYNRAMQVFLQMKNVGDLLVNLFIMALLPAVGEELFFRGSLQAALTRLSEKPWVAIIVSSAIFAFLHGTFFKLFPIFTLGIVLAVVYHVTRNLWYCILIHFINNAFAVLSVYYSGRSETLKKLAGDDYSVPLYGALVSLIIGVGIIYFIKKKSDVVLPRFITDEDNDYNA